MTVTTSPIGRIQLAMVPSTDPDRSVEFYQKVGFAKRSDVRFGAGFRWVEMYLRDGGTGIALVPARSGVATGAAMTLVLNARDIRETHAWMESMGIDVDPEIAGKGSAAKVRLGAAEVVGPTPPMFYFRDPDGNALLIVEAE